MSADKPKSNDGKNTEPKAKPAPVAGGRQPAAKSPAAAPEPVYPPVAPLFNRVDWLTFVITSLLVFLGYYWTLAPDLTLEDSGELAVGSFYAGVPHPPGYPVWTIFTWLVCKLVPISNIAWRVALASAIQGALGCGLIGMMVSRGSAMIIEGFENLRGIEPKVEKAICVVCGYVAGMLMGFNGYLWSQAVIVEVYAISVLSLTGCLIFLMRWMHAPHQRKYLYWSVFWLGICFTNHQTLLVAAIGIEVAVLARDVKLGRDVFFGNCVLFLIAGLLLLVRYGGVAGIANSGLNLAYVKAFVLIGLGSMALTGWLFIHTGAKIGTEWKPALMMLVMWILGASFYFYMPLAGMSDPPMQWGYPRTVEGFLHALTRGQYEKGNPTSGLDRFFGQLQTYVDGSIEEMNMVYLFIGLIPLAIVFYRRIEQEEKVWLSAASGLYGFVCLFKLATHFTEYKPVIPGMIYGYLFVLIGVIPFIFLRHAGGRPERAWLAGLTTVFLFLSLMLIYLLNPPPDRQSQQLNRVFFTASYVPVAMCVGYGLAMIAAAVVTQYARFRRVLLAGCAVAAAVAWYALDDLRVEYPVAIVTAQFALGLAAAAILLFAICRTRVPMVLLLALFAVMPAHTFLSHWSENEQRGHLFGFWFGHDMFTPPVETKDGKLTYDRKERQAALKDKERAKFTYPEMTPHTVLFGGTDPGRFCPTYMIFCESFIKPEQRRNPDFDRRDVYIITQNALADATYLMYIRAHYNRSTQKDPPFFTGMVDHLQALSLKKSENEKRIRSQPFQMGATGRMLGLLDYPAKPLDWLFGEKIGKAIERDRRAGTSIFEPEHLTNVKTLAAKLQPGPQQDPLSKWLNEQLDETTRKLLATGDDSALRKALAADFNRLIEREMPERWKVFEDLHRIYAEHAEAERRTQETGGNEQQMTAIRAARVLAMQARRDEFFTNGGTFYSSNRFAQVKLEPRIQRFAKQDLTWAAIRLNRLLLEAAYPDAIAKSEGGVYPDLEIHTPTVEDSSKAFTEYVEDARRRLEHDMKFPNEPRQIRPGEDVRADNESGRIQVSGQVAVMSINGLLTKVIFDKNPGHDFYVEESFPLDWMYPHLTPSGIIMKINREPLPEMTQDIVDRDHHFWSKYTERLIGNWITYDTTVSNICEFAEQVYVRRNLKQVKVAGKEVFPDGRFVRDDDAQKAFSKLRSAIAGVYFWRINEAGRRGNLAEQQRMIKECDFAFRQAFAFCPYSPEAVFRYSNLLMSMGKIDDALMIAKTFQKLDPNNSSARSLIDQLNDLRSKVGGNAQMQGQLNQAQGQMAQLEQVYRANPANVQVGLDLVKAYLQMNQGPAALNVLDTLARAGSNDVFTLLPVGQAYRQLGQNNQLVAVLGRAVPLCDQILADPQADNNRLQVALQTYQLAGIVPRMEDSLNRLIKLSPNSPELSYDLGALLTFQRKTNAALDALSNAVHHSNLRLKQTTNANDLRVFAATDTNYITLRAHPGFQKIIAPK